MSEAHIFASTIPQYDDRLFIELEVQYMKIPSSNLGRTCCAQKFRAIFLRNMFSPCSAKRRASDKDCMYYTIFTKLSQCDSKDLKQLSFEIFMKIQHALFWQVFFQPFASILQDDRQILTLMIPLELPVHFQNQIKTRSYRLIIMRLL